MCTRILKKFRTTNSIFNGLKHSCNNSNRLQNNFDIRFFFFGVLLVSFFWFTSHYRQAIVSQSGLSIPSIKKGSTYVTLAIGILLKRISSKVSPMTCISLTLLSSPLLMVITSTLYTSSKIAMCIKFGIWDTFASWLLGINYWRVLYDAGYGNSQESLFLYSFTTPVGMILVGLISHILKPYFFKVSCISIIILSIITPLYGIHIMKGKNPTKKTKTNTNFKKEKKIIKSESSIFSTMPLLVFGITFSYSTFNNYFAGAIKNNLPNVLPKYDLFLGSLTMVASCVSYYFIMPMIRNCNEQSKIKKLYTFIHYSFALGVIYFAILWKITSNVKNYNWQTILALSIGACFKQSVFDTLRETTYSRNFITPERRTFNDMIVAKLSKIASAHASEWVQKTENHEIMAISHVPLLAVLLFSASYDRFKSKQTRK